MDLDLWNRFGRKKLSYNRRNTVFICMPEVFPLQHNPENLDLSYNMDLDFMVCFKILALSYYTRRWIFPSITITKPRSIL